MGNILKDDLMKEIVSDFIEKENIRLKVYATKKKFKKLVTIVEGVEKDKLEQTAKELKNKLACGGTVKEGLIVLQGNHTSKIKDILVSMGYLPEAIEVKKEVVN
ncbi:MAG: stress response translation initiation inhibitor YciH [Candidatus Micrarchaeota archaeon]|nr:stress response translation initiation inhibitor YciH [Candidatus Micrarchaeota archaeon]